MNGGDFRRNGGPYRKSYREQNTRNQKITSVNSIKNHREIAPSIEKMSNISVKCKWE